MIATDDGFGPDLPADFVGIAVLTKEGDYMLTRTGPDPRVDALEAEANVTRVVSRMTVVEKLDNLDDSIVEQVSFLFDEWESGLSWEIGDVRRWDGTLIKCIQAHTNSDPNHTPDLTPALWNVYRAAPAPDTYPVWESGTLYNATWDDGTGPVVVEHPEGSGNLWENTHGDNNSWEPGAVGVHDTIWAPYQL
ncbi:MAG: hypothetical protein LC687_02510 [Actinobacteria bacterium]|nr:hypothetical protein [Actinomycetota bacterium]